MCHKCQENNLLRTELRKLKRMLEATERLLVKEKAKNEIKCRIVEMRDLKILDLKEALAECRVCKKPRPV